MSLTDDGHDAPIEFVRTHSVAQIMDALVAEMEGLDFHPGNRALNPHHTYVDWSDVRRILQAFLAAAEHQEPTA